MATQDLTLHTGFLFENPTIDSVIKAVNDARMKGGYTQDTLKKRVYADNNATTELSDAVQFSGVVMGDLHLGNPSGQHYEGIGAKAALEWARNSIETDCKAPTNSLIFTSGATESNHLAITAGMKTAQLGGRGRRIVTTQYEHASSWRVSKEYDPLYIDIDKDGFIDPKSLRNLIVEQDESDDIGMVSIILAHNELGVVQPIGEISRIIEDARKNREPYQKSPKSVRLPLLHYDGAQILGKHDIDISTTSADLISWSSHKFHGPVGYGGLFVCTQGALTPFAECCQFSGSPSGQEMGLRSGTEDVPGAVATAMALHESCTLGYIHKKWDIMAHMSNEIVTSLRNTVGNSIIVNAFPGGPIPKGGSRLCNTINLSFTGGISGADAARKLDHDWNIAVSTGSACSKSAPSLALKAAGISEERIRGAIRISISRYTTDRDVNRIMNGITDISRSLTLK